jgi:hypothetical protein
MNYRSLQLSVIRRCMTTTTTTTATKCSDCQNLGTNSLHTNCFNFFLANSPRTNVYFVGSTTATTRDSISKRWFGWKRGNTVPRIDTGPLLDPPKKPEWTDTMQRHLDRLEKRFERLELEPYGRNRGIELARQMIESEKLVKKGTKAAGNVYLNNWIYTRYALKLGYRRINDMPGDVLANTLIREGTEIRFFKFKNPKTILKELYRFNHSTMQERYRQKDRDLEPKVDDGRIDNGESVLPWEEELELRLFKPRLSTGGIQKIFGYEARRMAERQKKMKKLEAKKKPKDV